MPSSANDLDPVTIHPSPKQRPQVVIIGAGFGGLQAAKSLAGQDVDITLIDKRNFHLFQPLLYQVATADLSPSDVAWPIRGIFSKQENVRVVLADVNDVDTSRNLVKTNNRTFPYDHLIIATGAKHSYFGNEQWEPHAPGLKRVIDATEIRKRVLMAFERAEMTQDEQEQQRQLNFVIIGGGPTGVEMAGAIAELARFALADDFRHIDPRQARVILAEAGPRILGAFEPDLSDYAKTALEKLGVEVLLGERVSVEGDQGVKIGDEFLPAATVIWAAGVAVPRVKGWLDVETDPSGRILVDEHLAVKGHKDVYVVGDAALAEWEDGKFVPGIAPAAKQGGKHVAKVLKAKINGTDIPAPFKYKHQGNLATIGRHSAVVDLGKIKLKGALAWWFWGVAHVFFLIGVQSPLVVATKWFWSYLTFSKGARLITGLLPLYEASAIVEEAKRKTKRSPVMKENSTPAKSLAAAE